jgi:plasmid stabilization system protein ParE
MAHTVIWLTAAVEDVEGIASYIAVDSPAYASALVQRLLNVAKSLESFPFRGRVVPEWGEESI